MMVPLLAVEVWEVLLAGASAAVITGFFTYQGTKHLSSGRIATSDAATLWAAVDAHRKAQTEEILYLTTQLRQEREARMALEQRVAQLESQLHGGVS